MAVVPFMVLSAALLGGPQQQVQQQLRGVQQQLTALQEQLSAVQQQQTAMQHQLPRTLSAAGECPDSWSHHNDSCYLMSRSQATWLEANQACAAFDPRARLISVHPDDKDRLQKLLTEIDRREMHIWIGLFRRHDGSSWAWSDGTPVDYTNWRDGEPNNLGDGEHCAGFYVRHAGGRWNDYECSTKRSFLCQITLKWHTPLWYETM